MQIGFPISSEWKAGQVDRKVFRAAWPILLVRSLLFAGGFAAPSARGGYKALPGLSTSALVSRAILGLLRTVGGVDLLRKPGPFY